LTCGRLCWTLLGWCPPCRLTWHFVMSSKSISTTFVRLILFHLTKSHSSIWFDFVWWRHIQPPTSYPLKFICWILRINFFHLGQVLHHVCFNDIPSTFISFSGFYIHPHSSNTGCTLLRRGRNGEISGIEAAHKILTN
jgi:hypothetical protein